MLEEWEANPVREQADIEIIDILVNTDPEALERNWEEFPVREHYCHMDTIFNTASFRSPRRSCESLTMAMLQNAPWQTNEFPKDLSLKELQAWIKPLIDEEETGQFSGTPCRE